MKVAEQHHQYDIDFEAPAYDPDHRPNYVLLFGATGAALCILTLFSLVAALWRRVQAAARSTSKPWQQPVQPYRKRDSFQQPRPSQGWQHDKATTNDPQGLAAQQTYQRPSTSVEKKRKQNLREWRLHEQEYGCNQWSSWRQHSQGDIDKLTNTAVNKTSKLPLPHCSNQPSNHMYSADRPFRRPANKNVQQQRWQQHQDLDPMQPQHKEEAGQGLEQQQHCKPFRFRAVDADPGPSREWGSPSSQRQQQRQQQQQEQQEYITPPRPRPQLPAEHNDAEDEPPSGWDAALLAECAISSPYITSVEGLQTSPVYRSHISKVRGRRLNYETAESHKLRVYKALREVDPTGFKQLFSRKEVQEHDETPPSRLLSALECFLSSGITLTLLGLPCLLPGLAPHRALLAVTWAFMHLLAAAAGCTSPVTWLMNVRATHGQHSMLASWPRLLGAVVLEASLLLLTAGSGVLVSLGCRLFSNQRQGFGERMTAIVPMKQIVRPMHFSPLPPPGLPLANRHSSSRRDLDFSSDDDVLDDSDDE